MLSIKPIILCGGSGSRLWPLSRSGFPKQFLCLTGQESLFQKSVLRLMDVADKGICVSSPFIVTNEEHRFLALEQLREVGVVLGKALLEPIGRNTAPALTLAALAAQEDGGDPILVVTPADQTINDANAFSQAIRSAIHQASRGHIVILGIEPDRPETGYGYIKSNKDENSFHENQFSIEKFVEKPDAETAKKYIKDGGYFWNAGIFVLKASVWLKSISLCRPDILAATKSSWENRAADEKMSVSFIRPGQNEFRLIPSESIDYAVMEKCIERGLPISMVPLNAGWTDLGSWDSVWNALPKDDSGNTSYGDVLIAGSRNSLVHSTNRLVAVLGVNNLVVVETPDAVLIADKSHSQDVKKIVATLDSKNREEYSAHRKVHRPWGWYDAIDEGSRFKVKRISVKPKASLSLQKHFHRAEHWIVVKGTAEIVNGEKTLILAENQSTYIPLGQPHRLSNPGSIPLEIIEVQSGSYLGEDDIVRIDDEYGRN